MINKKKPVTCNIENENETRDFDYFPPDHAINDNSLQWSDDIYVCVQLHIISNHILAHDHSLIYE